MNETPTAPATPVVPFFQRRDVRFAALIIGILVIIFCCCGPLATLAWSNRAVILAPWMQSDAPSTVYGGTTEKVVDSGFRKFNPNADWVGDDFGPERTLPGTVNVLAIAEIKPYMGFECALIRVNQGESLYVRGGGAFYEAGSVNALTERWQHHIDEYVAAYPGCSVYPSVASFLAANPTYR